LALPIEGDEVFTPLRLWLKTAIVKHLVLSSIQRLEKLQLLLVKKEAEIDALKKKIAKVRADKPPKR
jgi:hypothetical protein